MELHTTRSLADLEPGQTVTVRRILFECLRARCGRLGLREGDRVRIGGRDGETLLVWRGDGGSVRCSEEMARFVEISATPH